MEVSVLLLLILRWRAWRGSPGPGEAFGSSLDPEGNPSWRLVESGVGKGGNVK